MHTELWPPLSLIRSAFERAPAVAPGEQQVAAPARGTNATPHSAAQDLLLPLTELARRREAVAERAFPARWAPGRLVSLVHDGRLLGVLLDKCIGDDRWQGWMAAGEADWAGAFDVLLEPEDEPFEPMFGMVQTWNPVTLTPAPQLCARVLGELSATRLAAIRAVHDEWMARQPLGIDAAPGHIALRSAGGVFTVVSGTPLGSDDPRIEYQALYREAAQSVSASVQAAPAPQHAPPAADAMAEGGWGARLRRWFGADMLVRPAFALLALVVVAQGTGLLGRGGEDDDVRFRSVPTAPTGAPVELLVQWKAGVDLDEAALALRAASAELVGGPDARGAWRVRAADPATARAALAASPLVDTVRMAGGSGGE